MRLIELIAKLNGILAVSGDVPVKLYVEDRAAWEGVGEVRTVPLRVAAVGDPSPCCAAIIPELED